MMASGGEQEEVYTLLLTDIPVDSMLKNYYRDHLLRNETGKVLSVCLDGNNASAIVKVKVKAATAASLLEEVQGNLKQRDRSEKVHFLYSESSTVTLNWNPSMKSLATGMIEYARKHYPMVDVKNVEGIQVTISGVAHDVVALQEQYNQHVAKNMQSLALQAVSESSVTAHVDSTVLDPLVADSTASETNSTKKEYPNLNPDALALLQKMPEGKIPGLHYDIKRGCVVVESSSSEEESIRISTFQAKFQEVASSRKLKIDALEIPEKLSDQKVRDTISVYDGKYSQCVFITQEDPRAVRVISNSSRQFEQARKMLRDDFNQALVSEATSATILASASSESLVIPLAGGRKLTLKKADIALEEVDVIVNAANRSLSHGAGVAGALNRASNGELQRYSDRYTRNHGQLSPGQVVTTRAGGSLKCKSIIHAVGPTKYDHNLTVSERLLCDVTNGILQEGEQLSAQSIAVPAISSGIFGVGKELVAKCVTDSIQFYKFRKPLPTLSDIRIVILDAPTYGVFAQLFATRIAILAQSNSDPRRNATHPLHSSPDAAIVPPNSSPSTAVAPSFPKEVPKAALNSTSLATEFTSEAAEKSVDHSSPTVTVADSASLPDTKQLNFGCDAPKLRPLLHQLADKWRILGLLLGFCHDDLLKISSVAGNSESYLEQIVTKWLCGDSSQPPTLGSLIRALQNADLGEIQLAAEVLKVYGMDYSKAATVSEHFMIKDINVVLPYLAPICEKWRMLGLLLGMNHEELAKLQGDSVARLGAVISSWLSGRCSKPAIMESLTGALRSRAIGGESVAAAIENKLLKTVSKEDLAVGGDTSGIHYPPLPLSDDEDIDQSKKPIVPAPGLDPNHGGTSIPPPLLRSLSDPTAPLSSLVTGSESHAHATGGDVHAAAVTGQAVKSRLAASYDLKTDKDRQLLGDQKGSASHKRRTSRSNKSHGSSGRSKAQPSIAANFTEPKSDKCVICLEHFKDPVMTRCKHTFCRGCIDRALAASPYCPICKVALMTIVGNQPPNGQMTTQVQNRSLPGYEGYKTIQIKYYIPDGTQGRNHPNPGVRYTGATRYAYLPDTLEGREVLTLLRKAFDARLTFTVDQSVTTGVDNTVVWNDIHHKTSASGGPYGYPDPTYLQRVKKDLAAKGIVLGPEDTAV